MSDAPRVSTVIPTYQRLGTLKVAVQSALAQTGASVVVRVFDNASTDDTQAYMVGLAGMDSRVKYYRHATNIGAHANFDAGMRSVDTEFFSILSDDDYLLPGFYEQAIKALDRYPHAMFWAGSTLRVDEHDVLVDVRMDAWSREGVYEGIEGVMGMMHGMAPTWTAIVFRREIIDAIGTPDGRALGPSDLDFLIRAAAHFPYIASKHPSAVFRLNMHSFSETQPLSSFWPGWLFMLQNVKELPTLDTAARERCAAALWDDALRMLFRRGASAIAKTNVDFATEAAHILRKQSGGIARGWLLGAVTWAVVHIPGFARAYTWLYRRLERRIIGSRQHLVARYGHLIRRAKAD